MPRAGRPEEASLPATGASFRLWRSAVSGDRIMASADRPGPHGRSKAAVVEEIRTKLAEADAAVLTGYRGLTVRALADLRASLRPAATEYKVFKNSLTRRAVESAGLPELAPLLEGPVAIAFVRGDAVVAAKALRDFGRANPALVLKGGLLGERVLSSGEVSALADIAPREVLLARLAGDLQAPLAKAARLLGGLQRKTALALKALIDKRGGVPEASPDP
jgi:large subunit ribosomal protein L10